LRLPVGICACATQTDVANRKIRAIARFGMQRTPFFLLGCGANLNNASNTVFSPSVGRKANLSMEAPVGKAT
jgi:hypothetical protein